MKHLTVLGHEFRHTSVFYRCIAYKNNRIFTTSSKLERDKGREKVYDILQCALDCFSADIQLSSRLLTEYGLRCGQCQVLQLFTM